MLRRKGIRKTNKQAEQPRPTQTPIPFHLFNQNYGKRENDHDINRTETIESGVTFQTQTITLFPRSAEPTPAPDTGDTAPDLATTFPSHPVTQTTMLRQQISSYSIDSATNSPLGMRNVHFQSASARPTARSRLVQSPMGAPMSPPPPFPDPMLSGPMSTYIPTISTSLQQPLSDAPRFPVPIRSYTPAPSPPPALQNTNYFPSFPPFASFTASNGAPPSLLRSVYRPLPPQVQTPPSRRVVPPGSIVHPIPRSHPTELPTISDSPAPVSPPPPSPPRSPIQAETQNDLESSSSEASLLRNLGREAAAHLQPTFRITDCKVLSPTVCCFCFPMADPFTRQFCLPS